MDLTELADKVKVLALLEEMMLQGEFSTLVAPRDKVIAEWWCRKTDKCYQSAKPTLWDSLCHIIDQAKADPEPWATEDECKETEKYYGIKICIPSY